MSDRGSTTFTERSMQRVLTAPKLALTSVRARLSKDSKLCKATEPYDDSLTHI